MPPLSAFRPRLQTTFPSLRRTLIAAPKPNSGPLLERRPDRALPPLSRSTRNAWLTTLPIFIAICTCSALAIFNYQKSSSSVVSSALYALRTNARARSLLGDEVYFAQRFPWISGELNQLHGRVDIRFQVKGTLGVGEMRFRSERKRRMGEFETKEWSLRMKGEEEWVDLLGGEGPDPLAQRGDEEKRA